MSTELGNVLFSKARRNLLAVLFGHPEAKYYIRELARMSGLVVGAIQRELARLTEAGVILRLVRGKHVFYQANKQCPIFAELVGIVTKTFGVTDVLRACLTPMVGHIEVAFVYGSAARGELRQGSDIDLMIVGDVSFGQVVEAIQPAQVRLGREINPTVYPTAEFQNKMVEGHHFLVSVAREPKVFLIGDEREFAGLVEERLAHRASDQRSGD